MHAALLAVTAKRRCATVPCRALPQAVRAIAPQLKSHGCRKVFVAPPNLNELECRSALVGPSELPRWKALAFTHECGSACSKQRIARFVQCV